MRTIFLLIFIFLQTQVQGQVAYELTQEIPVKNAEGEGLLNPWAGGLNSGQYSTMDVDGDGLDDLIVFDRTAQKISVFRNINNQRYQYSPEYERVFPEGLRNWVLLRDYNGDGLKDIFTSSPLGIKVYRNTGSAGAPPTWEIPYDGDPVFTKLFSNTNLQMNATDIPAIVDIDGDGDLDILVYFFTGNGGVNVHLNRSMENHGNADHLEFERVDQAWGSFYDCSCGNFNFGSECPPGTGGRVDPEGREEHAGAKSLLILDYNGNGKLDAIVGEEQCSPLYLLLNQGANSLNAEMNSFSQNIPDPNHPSFVYIFPAAYYEDVTFDGKKDLVIAPNMSTNLLDGIRFQASSWLYENTGTASNPQFTFQKNNFLQEDMIDLGENAVPAFIDIDNDGDLDMIVGNYGNHDHLSGVKGTLTLFTNVGSSLKPEFRVTNEDFLNLAIDEIKSIKPQIVDMNNDGRPDLVFTATPSFSFTPSLFYIPNIGNGPAVFDKNQIQEIDIPMLITDNPFFFDITGNGLPDLFIARELGNISFFENIGTPAQPQFTLVENDWKGFGISTQRRFLSMRLADLDNDGTLDLITADNRGLIHFFPDFLNNEPDPSAGETAIIFNPLNQENESRVFGTKVWPVPVNLFSTDRPSLVVGTNQGGLLVLKETAAEVLDPLSLISVFPNPTGPALGHTTINIQTNRNINVDIVNTLGRELTPWTFIPGGSTRAIDITGFPAGMYIVRMWSGQKVIDSRRIVVVK